MPTADLRLVSDWSARNRDVTIDHWYGRIFTDDLALLRSRQAQNKRTALPSDPVLLRGCRVMQCICATEIPPEAAPDVAGLLGQVRRSSVVLVANGSELHIVKRGKSRLHPRTLRTLRDNAGNIIAALRGEHRERVAALPAEYVAQHDPRPPRS